MREVTVRDNDAVFPIDGFVGHGLGEIDGQEDRVHLPANGIERRF